MNVFVDAMLTIVQQDNILEQIIFVKTVMQTVFHVMELVAQIAYHAIQDLSYWMVNVLIIAQQDFGFLGMVHAILAIHLVLLVMVLGEIIV